MQDNKKILTIILALLAIIVLIVSFINKNKKEESLENISIVTNASNFYTVNSCLYRVGTYISTNDTKNLLLLLNDKYKEKNEITEKNILNVLPEINENSTFVSDKMYYSSINSDITKYYVLGHIEKNMIFDEEIILDQEYESVYFIVYLDSNEKIFSIEPYDGEIFIKGDLNEG